MKEDQNMFTVQEYDSLVTNINVLRLKLPETDLLKEEIEVINEKLDHLIEIAKDLNKFDWMSLFLGTIASVIIQLGVTKENAETLWGLIKSTFKRALFLDMN